MVFLRAFFLGFMALLSQSFVAGAAQINDALAAYGQGDYTEAVRQVQPLAELGDANAQLLLGLMNAKGQGLKQNFEAAEKWLRLSANQGNARAQTFLNEYYENSNDPARKGKSALGLLFEVAGNGDADKQTNLAMLYQIGFVLPEDSAQAAYWYRLAADQGFARAQYQLALLYRVGGTNLPKNSVQSRMWFEIAANGGNETAREYFDTVELYMTPAEITEAKRLAGDWTAKHPQ